VAALGCTTNVNFTKRSNTMPILSAKDNPPSKSFDSSILKTEGMWWVAKVKPRQEKAFAFELLEQGIDYALPYYEKKVRRSDGKLRKSTLVLFPSYVPFICGAPHSELLKKDRISVILPVKMQERFKKELHALFLAQAAGAMIEPVPAEMPYLVGESVEITSGPLSGTMGIVVDTRNEVRSVVLSVDGLGSAKVTVDVGMITSNK